MKILLVTHDEKLPTIKRLVQEAQELKIETKFFNPHQFYLELSSNSNVLKQFEDCDYVFNRFSSVYEQDIDLDVLSHIAPEKLINSIEGTRNCRSKLNQLAWLQKHNLPIIPTSLVKGNEWSEQVDKFLAQMEKDYGSTFITKPIRGNGGKGITLFDSSRSLRTYLETCYDLKDQNFLVQPFLKTQFEIRVLLANHQLVSMVQKTSENNAVKLNFSRDVDLKELDTDEFNLVETARQISQPLQLKLCAVDFLITQDGKKYILEINNIPGWKYLEDFYESLDRKRNTTLEILKHVIKK